MRPLNPKYRFWQGLGVVCLLALMAWPALAEDRPDSGRREQTPEAIPQIEQDVPDETKRPEGGASLVPMTIAPRSADDRGGIITDAGADRVYAGPTVGELTKLEAAREAVEASRLAGTLYNTPPIMLMRPENAEALKLEAYNNQEPIQIVSPDGSGVVDAPAPIQEVGPAGLNAHEQAKRDGQLEGAPLTKAPDTAKPGQATEREAASQREGGR